MMARQPKWFRGLLLVLVAVAALSAAVMAVGLAVPQAHVASASILVAANPVHVWSLISDLEGSAAWHSNVARVEWP